MPGTPLKMCLVQRTVAVRDSSAWSAVVLWVWRSSWLRTFQSSGPSESCWFPYRWEGRKGCLVGCVRTQVALNFRDVLNPFLPWHQGNIKSICFIWFHTAEYAPCPVWPHLQRKVLNFKRLVKYKYISISQAGLSFRRHQGPLDGRHLQSPDSPKTMDLLRAHSNPGGESQCPGHAPGQ